MKGFQDKIGWFDGVYAVWVVSLINDVCDFKYLDCLIGLLSYSEILVCTVVIWVLGFWSWFIGSDG